MNPLISVCIPAYNRARHLPALLDSILSQTFRNYEIVVCEDKSPERDEIRRIVGDYERLRPGVIKYFENEANLGYDANLRNLFAKATGEYCFIMGNDDLMSPGALDVCAKALTCYPNIGVLIRSYAWFTRDSSKLDQVVRYFDGERFFGAGPETVVTFYRRVGAVSGIVIRRDAANKLGTEKYDGTVYYQMYLVANILLDFNGVYVPDVTVLCRNSEPPDFGNSVSEKTEFTPGSFSPSSRIHMIKSVFYIAKSVEVDRKVPIYSAIVSDFGNYSYPILAYHADQPINVFYRYYIDLAKLGLWANPLFHFYFLGLLFLGKDRANNFMAYLRGKFRYTPVIGRISRGLPVGVNKSEGA